VPEKSVLMTCFQRFKVFFDARRRQTRTASHRIRRPTFGRLAIVATAILVVPFALIVKGTPAAQDNPSQSERPVAEARQTFENRCAACHGLDGRGGERAPDIATSQKTQNRTDAALTQIIANGIPANGMPSFSSLDAPTIRAVVKYLRVLQGKSESAAMPGNPAAGKAIFFGKKTNCSQCHLVAGTGGFLGPDLNVYARRRQPQEIRDAIVKPVAVPGLGRSTVTVIPQSGQALTGVLRNEDNFSMQIQSDDGAFHSVLKSDVTSINRSATTLMPSDYGSTLNATELNDLISFLMSTAQKEKTTDTKLDSEPQDEAE
jgi:cytochrome c oxidase cbb3-type subunit 3